MADLLVTSMDIAAVAMMVGKLVARWAAWLARKLETQLAEKMVLSWVFVTVGLTAQ